MKLEVQDSEIGASVFGQVVYFPEMPEKLTTAAQVAVIGERVDNHIRFFWAAVALGGAWLASISALLMGVRTDLSHIQGELRLTATTQSIQNAVLAEPKDALPAFEKAKTAISGARTNSLPVDPGLLLRVATRAIQVSDQNNNVPLQAVAWQTVQEAINYVSAQQSPAILNSSTFNDCIEGNGPKSGIGGLFEMGKSPDGKTMTVKQKTIFHDCVLELDRVYAPPRSNVVFVFVEPVLFEDCIVKYGGGRPILAGTLTFRNCNFIMNLNAPPTPRGRDFAETLLASGLTQAAVPPQS